MDKWEEYQEMSTDKLMSEIEKMNRILFRLDPNTLMFRQIQDMIELADQVMRDKFAIVRIEKNDEDESRVLNIGEIESEVIEVDYEKEILDVTVNSYVGKLRDTKK